MPDRIRRTRSDTYEHAVSALLTRRSDLTAEAARLRDRLAEIRGDLEAMDRVLRSLGHEADPDATMPPKRREAIFGRGELSRGILDVLRGVTTPMTTREIAKLVLAGLGDDRANRAIMPSQVRSVSKALGHLAAGHIIKACDASGNRVWKLEEKPVYSSP